MADDDAKPNESNFVPPALPEIFSIPTALTEQWFEIPGNDAVQVALTRSEIDNLIIGILWALEAQSKIDFALTSWSNGDIDGANSSIFESRRLNIESQNRIRQLATSLMASALRERHHAK